MAGVTPGHEVKQPSLFSVFSVCGLRVESFPLLKGV
jgi:hypothetical protein